MAGRISVTENELLEALREARGAHKPAEEDGAMTRSEMERATGWSKKQVDAVLNGLLDEGRWECIWVPRQQRDGVVRRMPAYRPSGDAA